MRKTKKIIIMTLILSLLFSFNIFAMGENYNFLYPQPADEQKNEDKSQSYSWTWINDEVCVRFMMSEATKKAGIQKRYDAGVASTWRNKTSTGSEGKRREIYAGKWSQSIEGIWSFEFDDKTIPVGVNKIDGVLYAFNGYGELKAGYEYYTGYKTETDGLIKADSAEFTQWLATQYLPECTSHE